MSKVIACMYRNETEKLKSRSVSYIAAGTYIRHGKQFARLEKLPISPEKFQAMKILHDHRIRKFGVDDFDIAERLQATYVNAIIANSLRYESSRHS